MCFVAPEQKLFSGQFLLPDSEERLGTLIKIRTDISSHTHKPVNLLLSPLLLAPLFNPPPLIHWSKRNLSWIMIHSTDYSYWLITTLTLHVDWSGMVYSSDSRAGSWDLSNRVAWLPTTDAWDFPLSVPTSYSWRIEPDHTTDDTILQLFEEATSKALN